MAELFFFFSSDVFVEVFFEIVFDVDLVLGSGDDDVVVGDHAFVIGFTKMIENATRGFDDADAGASSWWSSDWFFVLDF